MFYQLGSARDPPQKVEFCLSALLHRIFFVFLTNICAKVIKMAFGRFGGGGSKNFRPGKQRITHGDGGYTHHFGAA